jgi:nucleolar protein 56
MKFQKFRKRAIAKTSLKLTLELGRTDALIINAICAFDELEKTLNLLTNRLRAWYGVHFPELLDKISNPKELVDLAKQGSRENLQKYKSLAKKSIGAKLTSQDYKTISSFANTLQALYKEHETIQTYLTDLMTKHVPTLTKLVGPIIGARLIHAAGSTKHLAMLPASTIQVLGAEKALFQHLRQGTPPPKHGFIFQCPEIRSTPKKERGKKARRLANKIAMAIKTDYFTRCK